MKKKFQHLRDMLTIWAIKRFNIQLPDLQQEHTLDTHKVYYYYGRWFRLVPHTPHTMRWIEQFKASQPLHLLDLDDYHLQLSGRLGDKIKIQNTIAAHVCKDCVLARLGLPCRKFYRNSSRMSDVWQRTNTDASCSRNEKPKLPTNPKLPPTGGIRGGLHPPQQGDREGLWGIRSSTPIMSAT